MVVVVRRIVGPHVRTVAEWREEPGGLSQSVGKEVRVSTEGGPMVEE